MDQNLSNLTPIKTAAFKHPTLFFLSHTGAVLIEILTEMMSLLDDKVLDSYKLKDSAHDKVKCC